MPVDSLYYQAEQVARKGSAVRTEPATQGALDKEDPEAALKWELRQLRDAVGRWQKGVSGNPTGRPRGSRNRATLLAQALLDTTADILAQKAIEKAISGDSVSLRFCLARILAPRRSSPVDLDLPPLDTQQELALAIAAVGRAVAAGEVTPAEAAELSRLFETSMRAIDAREREYIENRFRRRERSPAAPPLTAPSLPSATVSENADEKGEQSAAAENTADSTAG